MNLDDLKIYLPKYLSVESEKMLFENLKDFPDNIDKRIYTTKLKASDTVFQGDGLNDLLVINLPNLEVRNSNGMVFSNTCDIDSKNIRNFPSRVVYAPIFSLEKYKKSLEKSSAKTQQQISSHIGSIKKQQVTQIFFLPKIDKIIDDSIVFFDRTNNCPVDLMQSKKIEKERLFTLSDYGAYLFIFKLSIHFTRIQDKVDRMDGSY